MKICDFTRPELERLEQLCNFTKDELALFKLRSQNIPLEECAEVMNLSVSAVKKRSQKINQKVKKIIHL